MKISTDMETVYKNTPENEIPWNHDRPSEQLMELVTSGRIEPCRALDIGCGTGRNAIPLAKLGFDVVGIDIAPTAIEMAERNAEKAGVDIELLVGGPLPGFPEDIGSFGFAYEWNVLHHVMPEDREKWVRNVAGVLDDGAYYLSTCFAEADPYFGGEGKYRETRLGTVLYFSNERELRELFGKHFEVLEHRLFTHAGDGKEHVANWVLMRK